MQYTLLQAVQEVLSSLDSDQVTGITDTAESQQVATIVRRAFYDMVTRGDLPETYSWFNLTESGDNTKPTLMTIPSDINTISWIKYDVSTVAEPDMAYTTMNSLSKEEFLRRMYQMSESDSNVGTFTHVINGYSAKFMYRNDQAPSEYTLFDDNIIIFNSYDASVDTDTLLANKTLGYGKRNITWTESDAFTIPVNDEQAALLINEAKSLAWAELKQAAHQKAEQNVRRQWTHTQRTKDAIKLQSDFDQLPYFGRK